MIHTNSVKSSFSFQQLAAQLGIQSACADGETAPAVPVTTQATATTGSAPATGAPQQPSMLTTMIPFVLMFAVVYFLMIRPQQKRAKEQQGMLSALKQGDEVITTSGMLGKVYGITEKVVTLEVADNVKIKLLKSQVSQVMKGSVKDLA